MPCTLDTNDIMNALVTLSDIACRTDFYQNFQFRKINPNAL